MSTKPDRIHPYVPEAQEMLRQGRMSRREFLRLATLLGVSASTAYALAACAPAATPTTAPQPTSAPATTAPTVKRGGTIRVGTQVKAIDHPARYEWIGFDANITRFMNEYLTETGPDNVTKPYLLEKWEASNDLKTWTLTLRQGIQWFKDGANLEEFVGDHVKWNFEQWLAEETGSSILGLWAGFLSLANIEVKDKYTVLLHLDAPKLDVPESLFHYPAQILHPSFDGDISSGKNAGTGPHTLVEYRVGERAKTQRREGYWQMGVDGQPLTYIDAIEHIDLGNDQTAAVAALQAGQIDTIYDVRVDSFLALRNDPKVKIYPIGSSQVRVLRFRTNLEPWGNNDVRLAVKKVQSRQKILDQAYFGEGLLGHDTHASPVHPEWAPIDVPEYDPEGAKALLEKAGMTDLSFNISVGTGWTDALAYAENLKEDAKAAGINIELDAMPINDYWNVWNDDKAPVGITPWTHRPLAVMVLPLAYIAGPDGKPVPWNETNWVDQEFSDLLLKAQGTLDVEARRAIMKDVEAIQRDRGSIGISWWQNVWDVYNPAFQNVSAHPTSYNLWREVWYDPDQDPFK
ncbi:MAG: ABC transporter substrate-binding protein [Anaerolineales bacterium]